MLFLLTPKGNDSIEPLNKKWRDILLELVFFDPAGFVQSLENQTFSFLEL